MAEYRPHPALVAAIKRRTSDPEFQSVLLATALAESGGRLDAIGDNGNSGGPYQENSAGRGHGIPMPQRFDPDASTARAVREFSRYRTSDPGVWAARAQRPADPTGYAAKVRALLPAAQSILGSGGGPAALAGTRGAPTGLPPGGFDPGTMNRIASYLAKSEAAVLRGEQPPDIMPLLSKLKFRTPAVAAPTQPTYGVSQVPSSGGGWGGTEAPIRQLTELAGLRVNSAKRSTRNTASGGVSDHYEGSTNAYAHDLGWGGERPTSQSDTAASRIVAALGGPRNWGKTGGVFNKTINGIRYQVLYRTDVGGNHWNHIHVGARRVG
jgi:hypothetical protein